MLPVLLTFGPLSISSFGLFLAAGFVAASFALWRLARVYDVNEEKILDTAVAVFLGGLLLARVYFVAFNLAAFPDLGSLILINRYPGLSFWGGLMGGAAALWFWVRREKLPFWQMADFAAAAFFLGQFFADLGCFFGGCAYGAVSNLPGALPVVGLLGRRIPVSLIEALVVLVFFRYLWGQVVKFHFSGKIAALTLMMLGAVKFVSEFFRGDSLVLLPLLGIALGHLWSVLVFGTGVVVFYNRSKRDLLLDLTGAAEIIFSRGRRQRMLLSWGKSWYNYRTAWKVKAGKTRLALRSWPGKIKRRLNVKSTPTNFR